MVTIGYCYKFHLYASHSIVIDGSAGETHPHTWYISVYVEAQGNFSQFDETTKIIQKVLDVYGDKRLNDVRPFDRLNPTLENIGEIFFLQLGQVLRQHGISIQKLEIGETPVRIYVVDQESVSLQNRIQGREVPLSAFLNGMLEYTANSLSVPAGTQIESGAGENSSMEGSPEDLEKEGGGGQEEAKLPAGEAGGGVLEGGISGRVAASDYKVPLLQILLAVLSIAACSALVLYYINLRGRYPWGSDTYGHIFKADLLYKNIKEGNYFPLYTELWYNGIQPYRYWAPVPYYILAGFQFAAKGDAIQGYSLFTAFCFVFGALGWILWGVREKRIFLSTVIGILWFCMPDNIRVFFSEGNIPRVIITVLLPYLLYALWQFVEYRRKYALAAVIGLMALICLSHLMIAAMVGISTFLFMLYYGIANREFGRPLQALIGMLLAISLCGIWLFPALQGGLMSMDGEAVSEVMKSLTFPFTQTLNPMLRFGNIEIYYFGLSFILISLAGVFLSNKKSLPGFLTLITVFLGTTTAFVPVLIKLPLNQLLWMMRFTPVAYGIFAISMLVWKNLRRYVMILLMLLLVVDSGFSFKLLAFNSNPPPQTVEMLKEAVEETEQRLALLDSSTFGSFPSYYLCTGENPVQYAYGWAWQGASTASNIVLLNTALEKEYYSFMFDRCVEAGCDTVLVKKDKVKDFQRLDREAGRSNYKLIKEFSNGYLYKMPVPGTFGVATKYYGLAIGKSAANIVLEFPGFEIGAVNELEEYTLEELLKYEVIYLSGFSYRDQKAAEKLVQDAAERGVAFVVDMNRVPYEPITNRMTFLGVTAQPIQFENKLPDLHFRGIAYFPTTFREEDKKWNTVYLENVPNPIGFSWFGGNRLVFLGEHQNPNITFIGFNLLYHGIVNEDQEVVDMFGTVMGRLKDSLPERKIVPVDFTFERNRIKISTQEEDVNTTLANIDAFKTDSETYVRHNFLHVTQRETEVQVTYPYWREGMAISGLGLAATLAFLYFVCKKRRGEKDESSYGGIVNPGGAGSISA